MNITDQKTTPLADGGCFEFLNGLWTGKKPPFEKAIVVRNTNFRSDGVLDLTDAAVLDVESRQLQKRKLQSGDIIIERSGGGPKQPVGRVCYFDAAGPLPFSFSNFTTTLRLKDRVSFLPRFVHYYLLHLYHEGFTIPLQRATTGIRNLDFDAYTHAEIPRLPVAEQSRIAVVLWKVQEAIEIEDKLISTARELKQSAMRQLFTRGLHGEPLKETDIGPLPESWSAVPLGSFGRIGNGSTPLKTNAAYWTNGTIPWLTSAKVYDVTITEADQFVTQTAVEECHLPRVKPGSVMLAITGQGKTLGHAAVTAIETCVNQHIAYLQFTGEDANSHFIRLFLESRYDDLRVIGQAGGSTKGALTCGFLKTYLVPFPKRAEQDEIADMLMTIERKVAVHEQKRATLRELFKTLLHHLMTGQIRVHNLGIDTSEVTK